MDRGLGNYEAEGQTRAGGRGAEIAIPCCVPVNNECPIRRDLGFPEEHSELRRRIVAERIGPCRMVSSIVDHGSFQ